MNNHKRHKWKVFNRRLFLFFSTWTDCESFLHFDIYLDVAERFWDIVPSDLWPLLFLVSAVLQWTGSLVGVRRKINRKTLWIMRGWSFVCPAIQTRSFLENKKTLSKLKRVLKKTHPDTVNRFLLLSTIGTKFFSPTLDCEVEGKKCFR